MAEDRVIGLHGHDAMWLDAAGGWTHTIFRAQRFDANDAVLHVQELAAGGVKVYMEPLMIAAERCQAIAEDGE